MKLLNCLACHDIKLMDRAPRSCRCRKSSGYYVDHDEAVVNGPARVLGLANQAYARLRSELTPARYQDDDVCEAVCATQLQGCAVLLYAYPMTGARVTKGES